jgi:hypothetical protein
MDNPHQRLGHLGYFKTIAELHQNFFWPKMAKDVRSFVNSCKPCQKTKAPTTAPFGRMLTPSFPCQPLVNISIDFISPLKSATHYNMILSCTCRLSGYTCLIPTLQSNIAEKTALRFFTGWITLFGAPLSIISDWDKLWLSKFWQAFIS